MRVSFLFLEKYPNYDLDFDLFSQLRDQELKRLDSYVRTGIWGFWNIFGEDGAKLSRDVIANNLLKIFATQDGNVFRVKDFDGIIDGLRTGLIYCVQFYSIERQLALDINKRLESNSRYLGFTEILPNYAYHQVVFDNCPARYQIEKRRIHILYSSSLEDESESIADEIIEHCRKKLNKSRNMHISLAIKKRDTGHKFTIFDATDDPKIQNATSSCFKTICQEWELLAERTIYKFQDLIPEGINEFYSAIEVLSHSSLNESDCAQIAVNVRRTLEKVTDAICSATNKKPGWVKNQWKRYFDENIENKNLSEHFNNEFVGIMDGFERISSIYTIGNKGVHEDWQPNVFRSLILRLIILLNDLLVLNSDKRKVKLDSDAFIQIIGEN